MSTILQVADAIVASLNSGTFSVPLTAVRSYVPSAELADLSELRVTVVPKQVTVSPAARGTDYFECSIDVGIQKKVDPGDQAALDALVSFSEEIVDYLRAIKVDLPLEGAWLSVGNDPVYAPEHLDQQRVFTSVVTARYRVRR